MELTPYWGAVHTGLTDNEARLFSRGKKVPTGSHILRGIHHEDPDSGG
jgi:hypothetical protein